MRLRSAQQILEDTLDEHPGFDAAYQADPVLVAKVFVTALLAMQGEIARANIVTFESLPELIRWMNESREYVRKIKRVKKP